MKILLAVLTVVLLGCAGTPFKWDAARAVRQGMTVQEVTALVGPPTAVRTQHTGAVRYVWVDMNLMAGETKTLSIDFMDGRAVVVPHIPDSFK